eukprot:TRINITY_DN11039_c0_g1_i1.p1 TRINITY_DN11039_c0_g1~~TRINITY_DN11039_c0_g1_i1.p1  ORF type:complete len:456 (-),score=90.25 TRINITY_DN11039_c0_g1_i1:91-1458(-)
MAKAWGDFTSFLSGPQVGTQSAPNPPPVTSSTSTGTIGRTVSGGLTARGTSSAGTGSGNRTKPVSAPVHAASTPATTTAAGAGGGFFGGMMQGISAWVNETDSDEESSASPATGRRGPKGSATKQQPPGKHKPATVDRVGFLTVKAPGPNVDQWKSHYCVLIQGSFYILADPKDATPARSMNLADMRVKGMVARKAKSSSSSTEKHIIKLEVRANLKTNPNLDAFYGIAPSKASWQDWVQMMKESQKLPPHPYPKTISRDMIDTDSPGFKKKDALFSKMKEGLAAAAASSAIGKKTFRAALNEEGSAIFESLTGIMKRKYGSKVSAELESETLKLGVKILMLIERESTEEVSFFKPIEGALFHALDSLLNAYKLKERRSQYHLIPEALKKFTLSAKKLEAVFLHLVAPHFEKRELEKVSWIVEHVANLPALEDIFSNYEYTEDLTILCEYLLEMT